MVKSVEKRRFYGKLAKVGVVWGFLREGGNTLLLLPTSMVLARLLTPREAGVAAAATFFMQLCARLTQLGFGASLVRNKHLTSDHVSSVFVVNLGIGVSCWGALTLLAPAAGAFLRSPDAAALIPTAAFGFLIMPFATVPTAVLSREMRYREGATSEWLSTVVESTVAISLAWSGYGFWSLIYGSLAGDSARALCRIWMTRWRPRLHFSRAAMSDLFSFGIGMYVKNVLDFCAGNLDNVIVGRMLGMAALGFYDKAFATMQKFTGKLNLSGPSVSFRIFALIHDDRERFRRAYRKVILSITLVGYPLVTWMIVTAPQFIEVLFGKRWLPAVVPFQILCGAGFLRLLNTYATSATEATGKIWLEVKRQALLTALIVVCVAVMSRWGITGAALGVLTATATTTVMFQMLVRRLTRLNWSDMLGPQVPGVVCSLGLVGVLLLTMTGVRAVQPHPPATIVVFACAMTAAIYCIAFVLLVPFGEVRVLVHETVVDLLPGLAKRLPWLAPREEEVPALSAP